jgi:hypothetical protein
VVLTGDSVGFVKGRTVLIDWLLQIHPIVCIALLLGAAILWVFKRLLASMIDAAGEDLWRWLRRKFRLQSER